MRRREAPKRGAIAVWGGGANADGEQAAEPGRDGYGPEAASLMGRRRLRARRDVGSDVADGTFAIEGANGETPEGSIEERGGRCEE